MQKEKIYSSLKVRQLQEVMTVTSVRCVRHFIFLLL